MSLNITVIGCGRMGSAIVQALIKSGYSVAAVEKNSETGSPSREVKGFYRDISLSPPSDVYIFAVKPGDIKGALSELKSAGGLSGDPVIISVAAGVTVSMIKKITGTGRVARVMPNTPALLGAGMSCVCFPDASEDEYKTVEKLFSTMGETQRVGEEQMNAVTALSGSGPAYVYLMGEVMKRFAEKKGFSGEEAERLAAQTVYGAGVMMRSSGESFEKLRKNVTSPGGTTEAAVKHLKEEGFDRILADAIAKASLRASELVKE